MKQLFYISLLFLAFACNKESVQDPEEEVAQLLCEDDDYGFSIEVAGISFSTDECWLVYAPAQPNVSTEPGNPAVIKWEVPGYPEWNGANSFTFIFEEDDLQSGKTYEGFGILGVVAFDGSDGEMFQGLGEEAVTFTVDEFSPDNDYVCGSFKGKALFTDYQVVEFEGNFKGRINP